MATSTSTLRRASRPRGRFVILKMVLVGMLFTYIFNMVRLGSGVSRHSDGQLESQSMDTPQSHPQLVTDTPQPQSQLGHGEVEVDCKSYAVDSEFTAHTKTNPPFVISTHNPASDEISLSLHDTGCWECDHIQRTQAAILKNPDSYFLDVGGNIGMWSLSVAAMGREVYIIEPLLANIKKICSTVNINNFHHQVHLFHAAATARPTKFSLVTFEGNIGATQVREISESEINANPESVVHGVTIDSLGLPTSRPVVMKVDVEGHEMPAFEGGKKFLCDATIVEAVTELHRHALLGNEKFTRQIIGCFVKNGLAPFKNNEDRLNPDDLNAWVFKRKYPWRAFDVVWRPDKRN